MDIESLLLAMQKEQREDHASLSSTVTSGFASVAETLKQHELSDTSLFAAIDKRVSVVESTRRALIWLVAAIIVAVLGAGADAYINHHMFKEDVSATELPRPASAGVPRR